jgi:MFS family permease
MGDRWRVVAGGLGIGAIGMALVARQAPAAIVAGVLLGSVASGSVQTLVAALAGDLAGPKQRGSAIGLIHTAGDLGSAVGPLAAYALLPWTGLATMYYLCAALFGLELILVMRILPRPK